MSVISKKIKQNNIFFCNWLNKLIVDLKIVITIKALAVISRIPELEMCASSEKFRRDSSVGRAED
ncbi:MAG: hypothetical protein LBI56_04480 [Puniceicoccales bacterium]|nr:hypothetical protein [Puniceicoccales bacterium]